VRGTCLHRVLWLLSNYATSMHLRGLAHTGNCGGHCWSRFPSLHFVCAARRTHWAGRGPATSGSLRGLSVCNFNSHVCLLI
jgi:hypothetical protein